MEQEEIIEVLNSWNSWEKDQESGIVRTEYLNRLNKLCDTEQIVAVTGTRRSGKSTLLKQFIHKKISENVDRSNFLYINFEEPKFAGLLSLEFLQQIYDAYKEIIAPTETPYLILDEVQHVPQWEQFVRALHEKKEARALVSGSTATLLSNEFGTLLTGRWVELKLYPLSFREFLAFNNVNMEKKLDQLSQKSLIRQLLRQYLEFGGFPLVVLKDEKEELLRRYFEDIIGRDVAQRHSIRRVEKLKALAKYYLTNFSSLHSYRKITKFIDLSLDSVERFSTYLADAYLLFFIPKFAHSLKEQEVNPRKVYGIDPGLTNIVSFRFMDNLGRLYENAVFLHLLQKDNAELYYYKNQGECDFLVKKGEKIVQAIQVSYTIKENKEREIRGLLEAMTEFNLKEGLIVTNNLEKTETIQGKKIKYKPLWKFLLE